MSFKLKLTLQNKHTNGIINIYTNITYKHELEYLIKNRYDNYKVLMVKEVV
jgi:hypothetical protein